MDRDLEDEIAGRNTFHNDVYKLRILAAVLISGSVGRSTLSRESPPITVESGGLNRQLRCGSSPGSRLGLLQEARWWTTIQAKFKGTEMSCDIPDSVFKLSLYPAVRQLGLLDSDGCKSSITRSTTSASSIEGHNS